MRRPRPHAPAVSTRVHVVNVGYRSTNVWVVSAGTSRLMVDLGWPGTLGMLRANLERMDVPLREIRHGLATHFHMDHAGLAQELKQLGVRLIVLESQTNAIAPMRAHMKPVDEYVPITLHDNVSVTFAESRALLATMGLAGEILPTPGHSDDSVSLLLDDGSAFTGDLTPPGFAPEDKADVVASSWNLLLERGATYLYPGHGPARPLSIASRKGVS